MRFAANAPSFQELQNGHRQSYNFFILSWETVVDVVFSFLCAALYGPPSQKKAREVNEINGDRTNIQPIFDQYVNQPINGKTNKLYVQLTCYLDDQQINWLTYEVAK